MSFSLEVDKQVLEIESRRQLFELVNSFAGSHFRELQRKAKLSVGSTKYHLNYLSKRGLVKIEKDGKLLRYYPLSVSSQNRVLLSCLRQSILRNILLYILTHESCIQEDIVASVNVTASTTSFHIKKLKEKELIRVEKKGRKSYYFIDVDKVELVNLLITYKESFFDALVNKVIDMWEFE